MAGKKTGVFISAVNEPIIDKVMTDYGYTKISNAINFIIQEYDRLTKEDKQEVVEVKFEEEPPKTNTFEGWFVSEEN